MKISTEVGFAPPVLVSSTLLSSNDPELEKLQGGNRYHCVFDS